MHIIVYFVFCAFYCVCLYCISLRGTSPPEFEVGTLMQIVLPQILSSRYKKERSVAFNIRQNPFSAPDPAGAAHDAPHPLVG